MRCYLSPELNNKEDPSPGSTGGRDRSWHVWGTRGDWRGVSKGRRERHGVWQEPAHMGPSGCYVENRLIVRDKNRSRQP